MGIQDEIDRINQAKESASRSAQAAKRTRAKSGFGKTEPMPVALISQDSLRETLEELVRELQQHSSPSARGWLGDIGGMPHLLLHDRTNSPTNGLFGRGHPSLAGKLKMNRVKVWSVTKYGDSDYGQSAPVIWGVIVTNSGHVGWQGHSKPSADQLTTLAAAAIAGGGTKAHSLRR